MPKQDIRGGRRAWGTLCVLVTIGLCGAVPTGQPQGRDVRLTIREGTSMAAAVSPDGGTIALDLLGALWTLGIDGGPARRVLDDGYDAHLPAWSPDGRRLAFQAYLRDTWHIWAMNADGTGLQEVTAGPFDDREPYWSPDGTRLAFSSDRGGNYDIWTVTLATGEVKQITNSGANDSMPAWSPDGREIAFVSDRTERGIYARNVESGAERLLVPDATTVWSPTWTPDGKTVAYVSVSGADEPPGAGRDDRERGRRGRVPVPPDTGSARTKWCTPPTARSSGAHGAAARPARCRSRRTWRSRARRSRPRRLYSRPTARSRCAA